MKQQQMEEEEKKLAKDEEDLKNRKEDLEKRKEALESGKQLAEGIAAAGVPNPGAEGGGGGAGGDLSAQAALANKKETDETNLESPGAEKGSVYSFELYFFLLENEIGGFDWKTFQSLIEIEWGYWKYDPKCDGVVSFDDFSIDVNLFELFFFSSFFFKFAT